MDKQVKLRSRLYRAVEQAEELSRRAGASKTLRDVLSFAMCFLLSGAAFMPSATPFALAYSASKRGAGSIPCYGGAFFGYVLIYGANGLHYASAVLICYTAMILFSAQKRIADVIMPFSAAVSLLIIKGAIVASQGLRALLLLFCEAVLCGIFCLVFSFSNTQSAQGKLSSRILLCVALLLALEPMRILGLLSPARTVCLTLIMAAAYYGGSGVGAAAGVAGGTAMDMATWTSPFFSFIYGFSALAAGVLAKGGRLAFCSLYIVTSAAAVLWNYSDSRSLAALYECFAASVLFYAMPESLQTKLCSFAPTPRAASVKQAVLSPSSDTLTRLSSAVARLSSAVSSTISSITLKNDEDVSAIYDRAADKVCRKCSMATHCWSQNYSSTRAALANVTSILIAQNHIDVCDMPRHFASGCTNIKALCGAINGEYMSSLKRRAAAVRADSSLKLMHRQYSSLSDVISHAARGTQAEMEAYPNLEERVRTVASAYIRLPAVSVYSLKRRLYVDVASRDICDSSPDMAQMIKSISLSLGRAFAEPSFLPEKNGGTLRLVQLERYSANVSFALRKRPDSLECGDSVSHICTDDGRAVVMLADGMGSGKSAANVGRGALSLIEPFIRAGCGIAESSEAILPLLASQLEQNGFVTLDLLEIDLFSGRSTSVKYGAAPSFVIGSGTMRTLSCSTLPAGLEQPDLPLPQPVLFRLCDGEKIVLVSDGICDSSDAPEFSLFLSNSTLRGNELAAEIIDYAVQKGSCDDMAGIVIELMPNTQNAE